MKTQALINAFDFVSGKTWQAEASGRLLSKATNIAEFAEAEAAKTGASSIKFRHVIYAHIGSLRADPNLDVYSTPRTEDVAHADFVMIKASKAPNLPTSRGDRISVEAIEPLLVHFRACDRGDLAELERLRITL